MFGWAITPFNALALVCIYSSVALKEGMILLINKYSGKSYKLSTLWFESQLEKASITISRYF